MITNRLTDSKPGIKRPRKERRQLDVPIEQAVGAHRRHRHQPILVSIIQRHLRNALIRLHLWNGNDLDDSALWKAQLRVFLLFIRLRGGVVAEGRSRADLNGLAVAEDDANRTFLLFDLLFLISIIIFFISRRRRAVVTTSVKGCAICRALPGETICRPLRTVTSRSGLKAGRLKSRLAPTGRRPSVRSIVAYFTAFEELEFAGWEFAVEFKSLSVSLMMSTMRMVVSTSLRPLWRLS
ncbi:hypothetical protein TYRP_020928 [Tyrophagus putrescentiae]|nr:hypothetical protein TYRP_020928 [Tyrophagus putrescentiae]